MIEVHTVLILVSYCKMIEDNIDGIYYATPYLKDKGQAGWESGIAHFIFPGNEKLSKTKSKTEIINLIALFTLNLFRMQRIL